MDKLRIGPFEIIDKISDSIYKLKTGRKRTDTDIFHVTKLIPTTMDIYETDKEDTDVEKLE